MNKTIKWLGANWFNFLTLVLSLVAIVFSYFSYQMSKQSLQYEVEKDSFELTPAISESSDSLNVYFKLNNSISDLQFLEINFPDSITNKVIPISTKPIRVNRFMLEFLVKEFLKTKLIPADSSILVGQFSLPVMINYNAIVYGRPFDLRENRVLFYTYEISKDYEKIKYNNSILLRRFGFPIKKQIHWKFPWVKLSEDKIIKQDQLDVEDILNSQFQEATKGFRSLQSSSF